MTDNVYNAIFLLSKFLFFFSYSRAYYISFILIRSTNKEEGLIRLYLILLILVHIWGISLLFLQRVDPIENVEEIKHYTTELYVIEQNYVQVYDFDFLIISAIIITLASEIFIIVDSYYNELKSYIKGNPTINLYYYRIKNYFLNTSPVIIYFLIKKGKVMLNERTIIILNDLDIFINNSIEKIYSFIIKDGKIFIKIVFLVLYGIFMVYLGIKSVPHLLIFLGLKKNEPEIGFSEWLLNNIASYIGYSTVPMIAFGVICPFLIVTLVYGTIYPFGYNYLGMY